MSLFKALALIAATLIPSCQWSDAADSAQEDIPMPGSSVYATDYVGVLPVASITCPDAGNDIKAEDIRQPVAALLAEADDIRNNALTGLASKVDRAGDTSMTSDFVVTDGTLSVATPALVPSNAISGFGSGVGAGLVGVGGASGPGLVAGSATLPTALAPTKAGEFYGFVQITGPQPNSNVDPGANNALHATNIIKTWVTFDTSYVVLDGYNVLSVTNVAGQIWKVTFVRAMANANYGVSIHVHGAPGFSGALNTNKTASSFEFVLFKTDTLALGFGAGTTHAYIEVVGRQ